jgi:hypothetical protein
MTIGFSPFLTADVDETSGFNAQWSPALTKPMTGDIVSARLELIRRRVLTGYYTSPTIAEDVARRIAGTDFNGEDVAEG